MTGGRPGAGGGLPWGWGLALFAALFVGSLLALLGLVAWLRPPRGPEEALAWQASAGAVAAAGASWVMMSAEGRSVSDLGLAAGWRAWRDLGLGGLVGIVLMGGALAALAAAGTLRWSSEGGGIDRLPGAAAGLTMLLGIAALTEELVFRGYPIQVLGRRFGGRAAIVVTAVAFGAVHGANPEVGPLGLANTALAGILLGILWWRTWSLWLVTGVHWTWNWTLAVAADVPVSGLRLDTPGFGAMLEGPVWLTGGAYGPEGGVAVTAATLAGIGWALRTPRLVHDPAVAPLTADAAARSKTAGGEGEGGRSRRGGA